MKTKSGKPDIRTQIYLTAEEYEYVSQQSEIRESSIAEVVRQLIEEKMPKEKDYEGNPLFAIGKDGLVMNMKDGSVKHDEYLYRRRKK